MRPMRYRLIMFGFSAVCEDIDEVRLRLSGYPPNRATSEGIDQCYLIDLEKKIQYAIILRNNRYEVDENQSKSLQ